LIPSNQGDDARSDADDRENRSSSAIIEVVAPGDEAAAAVAARSQESSRQKPSAKRLHMILKAALVMCAKICNLQGLEREGNRVRK